MSKPGQLETDLVIGVLADIFQQKFRAKCEPRKTFPWLEVDGKPVIASAYFGPPLHCLFELDKPNRFTCERGHSLKNYPHDVPLGFDFRLYVELCDSARHKTNSATRRRAEEDAALDLLPPKHRLNPTLRLGEVEILEKMDSRPNEKNLRAVLESLLEKRLNVHGGTTFLQLLDHPSGKPSLPHMGR
jgi:hypothetical protein